jgi:DNA-3-methyladenine glycosylase
MTNYLKSLGLDISDAVVAAHQLLGYVLTYQSDEGVTSGYIVETEAYKSSDPASHSYKGLTKSKAALFGPAGTVYVYFTYGMHFCVNIVVGKENGGQAVLIRAIEPIEGLDLMIKRRAMPNSPKLTNGPGKLTKAMAIDKSINGSNVLTGPIKLSRGITPKEVVVDTRIGITKAVDEPWRFYIKDNPYVSRLARP